MWIYGRHGVREALREGKVDKLYLYKGSPDKELMSLARRYGIPLSLVDKSFFRHMPSGHQGVAARLTEYRYHDLIELITEAERERGVLVLADGVNDPRNLGALIRSARAFQATGLIIPKKSSVGITSAVVKSSAGTVLSFKVARVGGVASLVRSLKGRGFEVIALDAKEANQELSDFQPKFPCLLVVGGEKGLRRTVLKESDVILRIPMSEAVESLNLSVAFSIAMYHIYLKRGDKR